MDEKKLSASLKVAIDKWVEDACQEDGWIESYYPADGTDLLTDAAMLVLKAIESTGLYTESEHVD